MEDPRAGKLIEAFVRDTGSATIMLSVANFFQTIGFYGFANWVPTLLIAKGIHVRRRWNIPSSSPSPTRCFRSSAHGSRTRLSGNGQFALLCRGSPLFGILFSTQSARCH